VGTTRVSSGSMTFWSAAISLYRVMVVRNGVAVSHPAIAAVAPSLGIITVDMPCPPPLPLPLCHRRLACSIPERPCLTSLTVSMTHARRVRDMRRGCRT
jgi:hypothetical protein